MRAPDPGLDPALIVNMTEESRRIRYNNNNNNNNNKNNLLQSPLLKNLRLSQYSKQKVLDHKEIIIARVPGEKP